MKVSREQVVAGGVGLAVGVGATLGVGVYRDSSLSQRCEEEARKVRVFVADDATPEEIAELERVLSESPAAAEVEFVSKDEAYEEYRELYRDRPELTETIGPGDLPASFRLLAVDLESTADFYDLSAPAVDDVRAAQSELWEECLRKGKAPRPDPSV